MSTPLWYHGTLSRSEVDERTKSAGLSGQDGAYLVRARAEQNTPGELALMVVYRGKCTHHLLKRNAEGVWLVNNKAFVPGAKSVQAILTALSVPGMQGWPVVLNDFVPRPSTDLAPASTPFLVDEAAAPPPAHEQAHAPKPDINPYGAPVFAASDAPEPDINPYGAPVFAASDAAASSAAYRDEVAQSLPAQDAGEITAQMRDVDVGRQPSAVDNDSPRRIPAAVSADDTATLEEDETARDAEDNGSEPETAAQPISQPTRGSRGEELAKAYLRGFITRRAIASGRMRVYRRWLHGEMTRQNAEGRGLVYTSKHQMRDGIFLIRPRPKNPGQWALMCTYRNQFSHHLIEPTPEGYFTVNKTFYGPLKTLDQVVRHLSKAGVQKWPVPLSEPIPPPANEEPSLDGLTAGRLGIHTRPISDFCFETFIQPRRQAGRASSSLPARGGNQYTADEPATETEIVAKPPVTPQQPTRPIIRSPEELEAAYMMEEPKMERWKCGQCGRYNNNTADNGEELRSCHHCQAVRGKRADIRDLLNRSREGSKKSGSGATPPRPVDPVKQEARQKLSELLMDLPHEYAVVIRETLHLFAIRQISCAHLVNETAAVLRKVDSATRKEVEATIGQLLPRAVHEQYGRLLRTAKKEEYLSLLIQQTKQTDVAYLSDLVLNSLARWQRRRELMLNPSEQRIHMTSVARGWATLRWQADDVNMQYFDLELVAKEIHTGWSRAALVDWDIDNYGAPTRSPPVYNAQGFFDSVNFSSAATYKAYRERIQVALTPYLLNGVDDAGADRHTGVAGGPGLMEPQKRGYRLAAEVLLSQFRIHYSAASQDRLVMRLDHALTSQLRKMGVIPNMNDDLELDERGHARQRARPRAGLPTYHEEIERHGDGMASAEFGFVR